MAYLVTNVKGDGNLKNVVDEYERFELEGFPVGHDNFDEKDAHEVADEYKARRDGVVHQGPFGDSRIWKHTFNDQRVLINSTKIGSVQSNLPPMLM